jgi:hypothetical protein
MRAAMAWIPIAVAFALLFSLFAGLGVAAVLGKIAARLSELEDELWTAMPVTAPSSDR